MIAIRKNILVALILFLLAHIPLYAQYIGGTADGSAMHFSTNSVCGNPPGFYAFMGGTGDGGTGNTVINATCSTPPGGFAYMGGTNDGSSVATVMNTSCGLPPGAYAYTGGNGDGQSVVTLMQAVCSFPPQFYAYFGGSGDGAATEKNRNCAIVMPVADFTANPTEICVNQNVTFTDTSTDAIGWEWTVVGGTFVSPSTKYSQNPVVQYATAGTYTVTLKARNQDGDAIVTKSAYIKVNATATILATVPSSRCGAGSVTIAATPNSGTIKWYDTATAGTLLFTGNSFTTPSIATTTTYYAEAFNGCIASSRTAVVATINAIPSISGNPASRCDAGTITISANASAGTVTWYDAAVGGNLLGTGTVYTTPLISTTTTFYAETTSVAGCTSSRIPVIATVNATPTITATSNASSCGGSGTTISATPSTGTILWYYTATGGTAFASGNIINVSGASGTYYAEAIANGCPSVRTPVTYTSVPVPTLLSIMPGQICNSGSTTIQANYDFGTVNWYDAASGGTLLGTGSSFTTPVIATSTIYYAEATNGTCKTPRQGVYANVNIVNPPTANTMQNYCSGETLNFVNISGANIVWYDAASGGNVLAGTTLLSNGVTYYASQTVSGCESARLAITMNLGSCLGMDEFDATSLKVYPNPVTDILIIYNTEKIAKVEVTNLLGQAVFSSTKKNFEIAINMQSFATATYLVRIYDANGKMKVVKVIKK